MELEFSLVCTTLDFSLELLPAVGMGEKAIVEKFPFILIRYLNKYIFNQTVTV